MNLVGKIIYIKNPDFRIGYYVIVSQGFDNLNNPFVILDRRFTDFFDENQFNFIDINEPKSPNEDFEIL